MHNATHRQGLTPNNTDHARCPTSSWHDMTQCKFITATHKSMQPTQNMCKPPLSEAQPFFKLILQASLQIYHASVHERKLHRCKRHYKFVIKHLTNSPGRSKVLVCLSRKPSPWPKPDGITRRYQIYLAGPPMEEPKWTLKTHLEGP